ncbi:MAG: TlpA disulfide reductase family protein [Bacteroidota bacterium]
MSIKLKIFRLSLIALLISIQATSLFAQKAKPVAVTDKGELEKLKLAVEANPDSLGKHAAYIKAVGLANPALVAQYDVWMKKYPKSAAVPYALAKAYVDEESPKAKPYLLKTVAIDPKYTEAWGGLWIDGERWGDFKASRDYLAKAVASDPSNADYSFYYASSFGAIDQDKWRDMSLAVAKKFPTSERGAQALYWLGERSMNTEDKLKYFELLRNSYPPEKFNWSSSGMTAYFSILLGTDPQKAIALATTMQNNPKEAKLWANLTVQAQTIADGKKLLDQSKAEEALTLFNKVKLPKYYSFNKDLLLLKAQTVAQMGHTQAAYDSVMNAFVKAPSPSFYKALYAYGTKSGKSAAQVKTDIFRNLDATAQQATPFTLKKYFGEGSTSLADYKGKVVLVTYWFPGCGPCRGEFPHFEDVVRQYKNKPLEYVGINIFPDQNDYVIPFMKSSGYSFTPLEDYKGRVKGNMDNKNAAPVNFLLDQNGRIIFSNFRITEANEDDLKLMIDLLLGTQA